MHVPGITSENTVHPLSNFHCCTKLIDCILLVIPCPQDWTTFEGYCYLVSSQEYKGDEARLFCIEKGGELVKITSDRENDFVLALAREEQPPPKDVWIGMRRKGGHFYWSDNSLPKYTNWAPHEPNNHAEECSQMWTSHSDNLPNKASGTWNDIFCDRKHGLVCKRLP